MPRSDGRKNHVSSRQHQARQCLCWGRVGNVTRLGARHTDGAKEAIGRANRLPLVELLKRPNNSNTRLAIKRRLIQDGVLEELCAECGAPPEWRGRPLTLQLDHISGDGADHTPENVRLLCPNCHSQTPTFGGRNR